MDVKARMQQVLDIRKWNKENPEKKKSYPKRLPAQPDSGFTLTMKHKKLVTVDPVPYEILA
jgi:hypothetical protein